VARKIEPKKYRKARSNELRQFARLLSTSQAIKVIPDISPLESAAAKCINNTPKGQNSYGYNLEQLLFQIETPRHTLPNDVGKYLNLELSVALQGVCDPESDDPFKYELSVNIEVMTIPPKKRCAWHLDRHILGEEDNEAYGVHPLYHFQYGGHQMEEIKNLGDVLLLETPRLLHPPMDAILAIDFVLSNFAGTIWKTLREDGTYRRIVEEAQERFWLPYFKSIVAHWGTPDERQDRNTQLILPHFFDKG